jgi:hypothetical protein
MADCLSVRRLLQRVATGASVSDGQLHEALEHMRDCASCRRLFELAREAAFPEERTFASDVPKIQLDPAALFERALTAAMSDPETISRIRAAEQLGGLEQIGPAAVEALAKAEASDGSEEVRAAAREALERQNHNRLEGDFEKPQPLGPVAERQVGIPIPIQGPTEEPVAEPAEELPVGDSSESLSKETTEEPDSTNSEA